MIIYMQICKGTLDLLKGFWETREISIDVQLFITLNT